MTLRNNPPKRAHLSTRSKLVPESVRKFCEEITEGRERAAVAKQDVDVRNVNLKSNHHAVQLVTRLFFRRLCSPPVERA